MNIVRVVLLAWACFAAAPASGAWTWQRLEYPGASVTYANGIWENKIVGVYGGGGQGGGFVYDGASWTALSFPGSYMTSAMGVWENKVVGYYTKPGWAFNAGFLYDGQTWKTLAYPGARETRAQGVYGDRVVGYYEDINSLYHGFVYDGMTYKRLDYPNVWNGLTLASAIWGDAIVGGYSPPTGLGRGFLYEGSTWNTVHPSEAYSSTLTGISHDTVVGHCQMDFGDQFGRSFLIRNGTWTWLDGGWTSTTAYGISGDRIVGRYVDPADGKAHSFLLTIPEPTSLALLAMSGLLLARRRA